MLTFKGKTEQEVERDINDFIPRDYQLPLLKALDSGFKRVLAILPRRAGKDVTALNYVIRQMWEKPGVYYYIFPTYSQAKKVIWDSMTNDGKRILDYFPDSLVTQKNGQEMKIRMRSKTGAESLFQLVGSDNYDCFDNETEILTNEGWKKFAELNQTELVATLSDEQKFVWQKPLKYVEYDYEGDLYCIDNSSLNFRVTPNHRFYVKSSKGKYKFKEISDPTIKHDMIPSQCIWEGNKPNTILGYDSSEFMCFLGLYLSEGSTFKNNKCYRVTISQRKHSVRTEIIRILNAMGLNFVETSDGFNIENKELYEYCAPFGLQHERYIPREVLELSKAHLHLLFEYLVLGDGHRCDTYIAYYSSSKKLIDNVQEIIIKLGLSGNVGVKHQKGKQSLLCGRTITHKHDLHEIRVRFLKFKRLAGASSKPYIHKQFYKGSVHCVSVPNQTIKVRRKGKEFWSGNSLMGTNPRGVVFSEYALQDPRAYQYIRPILTANQGWALFISCVVPNTLVIGSNGFQRIKDVSSSREEYSDLNKPIFGLGGFHNAEQFYYGGKQDTLKITLENGFSLECTPIHPVWNGSSWVNSKDLKIGDLIPVQYGQNVFGSGVSVVGMRRNSHGSVKKTVPEVMTDDLFYLAGLVQGDGSINKTSITIANSDPEIIDFLRDWGFKTSSRPFHHTLSSVDMCDFLKFIGIGNGAKDKTFPEKLFHGTNGQIRAFIQGWFDTDGSSHANRGTVKLSSICQQGMNELQIMLLNFGIVTSLYSCTAGVSKKVKGVHTCYTLECSGYFAGKFYNHIGFRLPRKQRNKASLKPDTWQESGNIYPVDVKRLHGYSLPKNIITNPNRITRRMISKLNKRNPHPYLEELLNEQLYYSPIKSIEKGENEVFDFVIPDTHSFMSNGFISHNTPRGKNHLYTLAELAQASPDWFYLKLSIEDTGHIPLSEIEKERREGLMSEDMIQQEYYTSFTMGVEGAYYAKYMDKMHRENRIDFVPWENGFKVHTAWDIGVRDSTTIIFFQTIGQTVRIIDCYENSKEGLEHYAAVIQSKPYLYGTHIAPHDIKVTEWSSGITRLEKARQLGIRFTIADDYSIPDGIEASRSLFSKLWIDKKACEPLIKALENYRQEYDVKKKIYKPRPLHDWSSHFCDAFRYLAVSLPKTRDGASKQDIEARYQKAMYGAQANLPPIFRDAQHDGRM